MYANFFGLRRLPFEDRVDTKFFFGTPACEEKLKALEHECHGDPQIALVLGEAGVGKTMLIRTLALRLPVTDHAIVLTCRSDGKMNVLRDVCKTFGAGLPSTETAPRCLARLRRHLKKARQADHRSILIIDQAENLSSENLSHITMLADLEDHQGKLLTIILVGQLGLRPLLDRPEFVAFRRRLVSELTLSTMTQAETQQYIVQRLHVAGSGEADLFDQDAVAVIYRAAKGLPAATNRFCDAAMVAACGADEKRVTRASAIEATRAAATQERSADIRDVGIGGPGLTPGAFPGVADPHAPPWDQSTPPQPTTPVYLHNGYGGDDFGTDPGDFAPSLKEPADGGMIDALPQGSAAGTATALYTAGDTLIDCLESTIAKAERVSATSEATLTQQAAVEKHLGSLMPRAERLTEGLNQTMQDAAESLERVQDRFAGVMGVAEQRLASIETHLTHVAEASQSVDERIGRVEHACELAEHVESRLASFAEQLADRADAVQEQMTRLMTGIESGEEVTCKLDSVLARASTLPADTKATANAVQARMRKESETLERELEKCSEETLRRQEQASADALAEHERKLREQFDAHRHLLQQTCEVAQGQSRTQHKLATETLAHFQKDLQTALSEQQRSLEEAAQSARDQVTQVRQDGSCAAAATRSAFETELATFHAKLRKMIGESANNDTSLTAALAAGQEKVDGLLKDFETLESRRRDMKAATDRLSEEAEHVVGRTNDLTESMERTRGEVGELAGRADDARGKLAQAVERGENLVSDVHAGQGQIEALQHGVAATLVDVGSTCERVNAVREQVAQLEQTAARLTATHKIGAETAERLDRVVTAATHSREAVKDVCIEADEKIDRIHTHSASAADLLERLDRAERDARDATETADKSVQNADRTVAEVKEQTTKLGSLQQAGDATAARLDELAGSCEQLNEAIEVSAADAEEKIAQLDTRSAGLAVMLDKLVDATGNAVRAIEEANAAADAADRAAEAGGEAADQAREQNAQLSSTQESGVRTAKQLDEQIALVTRLLDTLGTLAGAADEKIEQLDSNSTEATHLLKKLSEINDTSVKVAERVQTATEAAEKAADAADQAAVEAEEQTTGLSSARQGCEEAVDQLNEGVASAAQLHSTLKGLTGDVDGVIGRLNSHGAAARQILHQLSEADKIGRDLLERADVASALARAAEVEGSIRKNVDNAEATRDKLIVAGDAALRNCAELTGANAAASTLIDKQEELSLKAQDASEQLTQQVNATSDSVEAGETLLREFSAQSRTIQTVLEGLRRKATAIEESLKRATSRPSEIITTARTQAAQLERVSGVVRKVSAGLARTTLEAKQQLEDLRGTSGQASERLTRLTTETERASTTLREWVGEAMRVQARLDKSLKRCPSINETHPGDSLEGISEIAQPLPRIANRSALDMRGTTQEPVATDESLQVAAPDESEAPKPHTKAEEIARLIQEAKNVAKHVET